MSGREAKGGRLRAKVGTRDDGGVRDEGTYGFVVGQDEQPRLVSDGEDFYRSIQMQIPGQMGD